MPTIAIEVALRIAETKTPLGNARFKLIEVSSGSEVSGTAGVDGRATVSLSVPQPRIGRRLTIPELVVELLDAAGAVLHRQHAVVRRQLPPAQVEVDVDLSVAAGICSRLKERTATSPADIVARWQKELARGRRGPGPGPDPCLRRAILDTLSGLADPKTPLQKQVSLAVRERMSKGRISREHPDLVDLRGRLTGAGKTALIELSAAARSIVEAMDAAHLPPPGCDANMTIEDFADRVLAACPPLHGLPEAIYDEFPEEPLPPQAGEPFESEQPFDPKCLDYYNAGSSSLDAVARAQMDLLGAASSTSYSATHPPRINHIDVIDPRLHVWVYGADIATKKLTTNPTDNSGGAHEVEMDVSLAAPPPGQTDERLVDWSDEVRAGDRRQILMVDVVMGQKVRLQGSGFIQKEANVLCRRRSWRSEPRDGMLVPFDAVSATDVIGPLPVHGDHIPRLAADTPETYLGDSVVIDWPFTTPGLYELRLLVSTEKPGGGRYAVAGPQQDNCLIPYLDGAEVAEVAESNVVWLAVIPAIRRTRIIPSIAELACIDRTNIGPIESWADTVRVTASLHQVGMNSALGFDTRDLDVTFQDMFTRDNESHAPNRELGRAGFASDPELACLMLHYTFYVAELLDDAERFAIQAAEAAVLLLALAILLQIVGSTASLVMSVLFPLMMLAGVATVPATAAGLIILAAGAFPAALQVSAGLFKIAMDIGVPIILRIFSEVDAALWGWLEARFGARPIINTASKFMLGDIFMLGSPFRFFSRFVAPRNTESGFGEDLAWESYTGRAHGGEYRIKLHMDLLPSV